MQGHEWGCDSAQARRWWLQADGARCGGSRVCGKCVLLSVYAFGCLWMYVGVSLRMGVHPCVTVCVKENTSTSICAYVHAND